MRPACGLLETKFACRRFEHMARYFFHIDGGSPHRDEVGEELPDDAAAWRTAMQLARDIESNLQPGQSWHLDVREGRVAVYLVEIKTRRHR
jgi:hypothetical protein